MSKMKNFTLKDLKKISKQYDEKMSLVIDGKWEITIDKKFKKTKIQTLFSELSKMQVQLKEKGLSKEQIDAANIYILHTLIIKNFTNIPFPEDMTVDDYLLVYEDFLNTGVYFEIFNNGFDVSEVEFLLKYLEEMISDVNSYLSEGIELNEQVEIQNKEMIE